MKKFTSISNAVIRRLPRYRRILGDLLHKKIDVVSSSELGGLVNYTASQIRQDLHNFGSFGLQGYGYSVKGLYKEINTILGLEKKYKMVIVGAGNLGQALTNYTHYYKTGFNTVAIFDVNPKIIGVKINDIEVLDFNDIEDFLDKHSIDIGIITTNRESAQNVTDKLVNGGVKGIWNFSATDLNVPDHIAIENAHLTDSLYILSYQISQNDFGKIKRKKSS